MSSALALGCAMDTTEAEAETGAGLAELRQGDACSGTVSSERAGQLDTSFGAAGTGIARLRFGADDDGGFFDLDVIDDAIVAAGWGQGGLGQIRFRVARLTEAGAPDLGFGGSGMVTTSWAASTADAAYATTVGHQRDGDIVAMGWRDRFRDESANFALARYNPDGSLDREGFGAGGKPLIDLGKDDEILDGLVLPNDRILVVGKRGERIVIARLTADGDLDRSFARPDGYQTVLVGNGSAAHGVAVDQSGRIIVVGFADMEGQRDMVVLRLSRNGALDRSFGEGGQVVVGDPAIDERAVAVALSPDGRIVVAGDAGAEGARDFQVRRFLRNGSPDLAFGNAGVARAPITAGDDQAEDMALLPGGDVLVVGNRLDGGDGQPLLARYTCSGALDPSFSEGGVLALDLGEYGVAHTVRMYSDDRVLIGGGDVGATPGPGTYGVVARLWL